VALSEFNSEDQKVIRRCFSVFSNRDKKLGAFIVLINILLGILDLLGVIAIGLVGYKTNAFPGFYLTDSGYTLEHRVDSPEEIASIIRARTAVSTHYKALVVANPVVKEMPKARHDEILATGLARAKSEGIDGKLVTPFLLEHFHTASHGESLAINTEIIKSNCLLAAQIAVALA
jgi:pseudouridine-5'-phosphate glycosidase